MLRDRETPIWGEFREEPEPVRLPTDPEQVVWNVLLTLATLLTLLFVSGSVMG